MPAMSPRVRSPAPPPRDFSNLLRPELYHPLPPINIPVPFRNSTKQPSPDPAAIPDLLDKGHYRVAAIAAARALTATGPDALSPTADHERILALLYVRLACLTLIDSGTAIAAQEAKAFEDGLALTSTSSTNAAPWPLRLLNVRLQAIGFGDPRRAVMSYYELAREARAQMSAAKARRHSDEEQLWKDRLSELGIKVAGALVEMDDLAGAAHHLSTLTAARDGDDGSLGMIKALLWLHLGDVDAARAAIAVGAGKGGVDQDLDRVRLVREKIVVALAEMADGEYDKALDHWQELRVQLEKDEMIGVNLAVCLLYVGRMQEGKALLESLVEAGYASHTLLFNLSTMYELSTERSRDLKLRLAERLASMEETPFGWEKANADFKL